MNKLYRNLNDIPETSLTSWECAALARGETMVEVDYPDDQLTGPELAMKYRGTPRPAEEPLTFWQGISLVATVLGCMGALVYFC